ncbi:MAG: endonuclease/exonuclease/phosphatase family protein [Paludibacteraceae bacterium]|nr:endonuclease/exonuclease/phosphatase family protein [Paludibacteraceae bacterium]
MLTLLGLVWVMTSHGSAPSEEELAGKKHRLTVLTWNTARLGDYKKPDRNDVLNYLSSQDADILCLQEVDVYKNDRYLTLAEVKQVLSAKYPYSYLDFSVYNSRHQFGTMVWSKYPLVHKKSLPYEAKTANLSNRCDVVIGQDTIRLFNNHLQSYSFTPKDLEEAETQRNYQGVRSSAQKLEQKWERALPLRNAQARIVRTEIQDSPYPVIVVGDFNSIPLSYTYWHISRGLLDAFAETSWFRWGTTCEKRHIGLRIDYILSSPSLVPISCSVPHPSGSDHWPVVATLAW